MAPLAILVLVATLATMWVVEVVNAIDGQARDREGIVPRSEHGLLGIVWAPFLHASFQHLIANSVPFLVLGLMIGARYGRHLLAVLAVCALTSGLVAWAISPAHTVVIGASGVVFGMLAFLLFRALFLRSVVNVLLAVVTVALYGGALGGLLPSNLPISWQDHLGGFIGGAGLAATLPGRRRRRQSP